MADATYIEPVEWQTVAAIIAQEKPDVLLPTMGGQTALNCALDLVREGVLEAHGVELIGASQEAIDKAEDRERFDRRHETHRSGNVPRSAIAHSLEEAAAGTGASWDFPVLSGLRSPWAVQRWVALPTTRKSSIEIYYPGAGAVSNHRAADRRESVGLERVRNGGGARPFRQLHHRLLHRKLSIPWVSTPVTASPLRLHRP